MSERVAAVRSGFGLLLILLAMHDGLAIVGASFGVGLEALPWLGVWAVRGALALVAALGVLRQPDGRASTRVAAVLVIYMLLHGLAIYRDPRGNSITRLVLLGGSAALLLGTRRVGTPPQSAG